MIHQLHQLVFISGIVLVFSCLVSFQTSKLMGVTIAYFICSAIYLTFGPWPAWGDLQFRVDVSSAHAAIELFLAAYFSRLTFKLAKKQFYLCVEVAMFLNNLAVLAFGFGMFNAYSVDSTMAAITLPIILNNIADREIKSWPRIGYSTLAIVLPIFVSIKTGGTSFFYVIMSEIMAYHTLRKRYWLAFLNGFTILAVGWARLGRFISFTETGDRYEKWKMSMSWWWENANLFFGTGTGSFWWLGAAIQNTKVGILTFMHNDWLQVLFEQGIIGLCLLVAVFIQAFLRTDKIHLKVCLVGISVAMLAQYPLRMMASLILVMFVLFDSLSKEELKNV